MFDLIDKKKHEIKWWTVPSLALAMLLLGINLGILIGRRDVNPSDWVQVAFLLFISLVITWPVARELIIRREEEKNPDVH